MQLGTIRKTVRLFDYAALGFLGLAFFIGMNVILRNMGGGGVQIPYNIFFLLSLSGFVVVSVTRISVFRRINAPVTLRWYVVALVLLLIPLTYSSRLFLDVETLRLIGLGLVALYLICLYQFSSSFFRKKLLAVLFVSTLIQTIWGLVQYYVIFDESPLFYLADKGRPYGIFQQVNVFVSYIAVGSLLSVYYATNAKTNRIKWFLFCAAIVIANAHLGVLAAADSASVGALLSVVLYCIVVGGTEKEFRLKVGVICMLAVLFSFTPKSWFDIRPQQRAATIETENHSASSLMANEQVIIGHGGGLQASDPSLRKYGTRPTIYAVALEMIADKPLTGHGIGSFPKQYLLYQAQYLKENPGAAAEFNIHHAHNIVLQWTIELGALALIAFLFIFVGWILFIRKGLINYKLLLVATPIVFQAMVEIPFSSSAPHLYMVFTIVLLSSTASKRSFKIPRFSGVVFIPGALYGAFLGVIFLLSTMHALNKFLEFNQSQRENVALLLDVKNPAAFKLRYEFELFQWKLRKARETNSISEKELKQYMMWAYSTVQYAPMESTYENFVQALILYGNSEAALKYAREGSFIYPYNDVLDKQRKMLEKELVN